MLLLPLLVLTGLVLADEEKRKNLITYNNDQRRQAYTTYSPSTYLSYIGTTIITVTSWVPCPVYTSYTTVTKCEACVDSCTYCPTFYDGGNCCTTTSPVVPCTYCATPYDGGNCCSSPTCTYCATPYDGGNCCSSPTCTYCATPYDGGKCCSSPTCTYCATTYDGGNCCADPVTTYMSDGYVYVVVTPAAESTGNGQVIYASVAHTEISIIWMYAWIVASIAIGMGALLL